MKRGRQFFLPAVRAFTLIELIGVLAIITILASTLTPNILRSIERAAVRAETENLHALGGQIALYLRDNAVPPTAAVPPLVPNWTTQLATYSTLNATEILTNSRQVNRLYVPDPTVANQRILLLSSMRGGVALPPAAAIAGNFTAIWDTAPGAVPPGFAPLGWTAAVPGSNIDYLVIERVNLASVYRNELQPYTVTLNNVSGTIDASYQIIRANGVAGEIITAKASSFFGLPALYSRDLLNLFDANGVLNYTYVISNSGKTFTFTGTTWIVP